MGNAIYVKGFAILLLCVFTLWSGISPAGETGIVDSRHDLSYQSGGDNPFLFFTNQRCVFCHTPHGAREDVKSDTTWTSGTSYNPGSGGPLLLWNRPLANIASVTGGTGYLLYQQTSTLDATVNQVRVYSLLCLSCHDGVSALNVVSNFPNEWESLGFIPPMNPGGPTTFVEGNFDGGPSGWGPNIGQRVTDNDPVNLRGDHPISFDYTVGLDAGLNSPALVVADTNLKLFSNGGTPNISLECPTCHDVHNEGSKDPYDPVLNPGGMRFPFLRMMLDNSAMCTACHLK